MGQDTKRKSRKWQKTTCRSRGGGLERKVETDETSGEKIGLRKRDRREMKMRVEKRKGE